MKVSLGIMAAIIVAATSQGAVFSTNTPDKDTFVRALAPNSNYGAAGALSISGTTPMSGNPTNGVFDSFMSFNTANIVSNFNYNFGANNWVITSATLNLTENPTPGNPVFNYGTGRFSIQWIAKDTWTEGTGNPNAPASNGLTYSQESSFLDTNTDVILGTFDFTGTAKLSCSLALANPFVTNIGAGGEVGLYLTAVDPTIGYVFYSRNYAGNPASLPTLIIGATVQPGIAAIAAQGPNFVLNATNGLAGNAYIVLTSTNLDASANQWTPIATNVLSASGNFSITLTNAVPVLGPQFFLLQTE